MPCRAGGFSRNLREGFCPAGRAIRRCSSSMKPDRRNPLKNLPRLKNLAVLKDLPYASGGYHCNFGLFQTQYGSDRLGFLLGFSTACGETKSQRALTVTKCNGISRWVSACGANGRSQFTDSLSVKRNFQPPPPGVVVISSAMLQALSVHKRQKLQQRLKTRNLLKGDP